MSRKIHIEPVTRIEGHARIALELDEAGRVADARFHVVEFRGFEKFVEGRHFSEMPAITSRICGICPVSHHLAAAKAGDELLGVKAPPTAQLLRQLMHKGQVIQSHALSFFHLSSPDLIFGFDADPARRNILGLAAEQPEIARRGIALRRYGQEIIRAVGGRRIHPDVCVPGGMNQRLRPEAREEILAGFAEAMDNAVFGLNLVRDLFQREAEMAEGFADFPSKYLGLVDRDGRADLYDGRLRLVDADGGIVEDQVDARQYLSLIGEITEDWSYLKFPFYRAEGYPQGFYRVGPLARLNAAAGFDTPRAHEEWKRFRAIAGGKPVSGSMYYHYARLVEIIHCLERVETILADPAVGGDDLIATSGEVRSEGVGVIEAPRGTLIHHYYANPDGSIARANLIVATGHNNLAMNRAVKAVAEKYVDGGKLREGMLNRVEAAIRCYDPCLSCSTHALGQMPLRLELRDSAGALLQVLTR